MPVNKQVARELRARVAQQPHDPTTNHMQTHMVLAGRLKYAAYQDGDVLRAVDDDRQLAFRVGSGKWSRAVQESKPRRPGLYDNIKALGPAVTVELEKGQFY